mmetsp:Transcript_60367/g.165393  ORF Transcript_60367/g.165393 Transcript_60367/m.165393 type:complete len:201 (-) Transcript_60367:150-752(-)
MFLRSAMFMLGCCCTHSCRTLRLWNQTPSASGAMLTRSAIASSWSGVGTGHSLYAAASNLSCSTVAPLSSCIGGGRGAGALMLLPGRASGDDTPAVRILSRRRAACSCPAAGRLPLGSSSAASSSRCRLGALESDMRQSTALSVEVEGMRCTSRRPAAAAASVGELGGDGSCGGGISPSCAMPPITCATARESKERVLDE